MDPEQTAPIGQSDLGPHCLPLRLLKHFSRREKQTTFVAIGALRVRDYYYTFSMKTSDVVLFKSPSLFNTHHNIFMYQSL